MPETFPVAIDGYTDLPPGRIANVVTFLEITRPPDPGGGRDGFAVRSVATPEVDAFRALYRRIGQNWLWFSHLVMPEAELAALLAAPTTRILTVARDDGDDVGLAEIDFRVAGEAEIVTFGVVQEAMGTGAAHALMAATLAEAFRPGVERVWLHTCSFDHQRAVPFYARWGFRPWKMAIEVSEDPRATGALPESAAPHVPYFGRMRPPKR